MDGGSHYLEPSERQEAWDRPNKRPVRNPPSSPSYFSHLGHLDVGLESGGKSVESQGKSLGLKLSPKPGKKPIIVKQLSK